MAAACEGGGPHHAVHLFEAELENRHTSTLECALREGVAGVCWHPAAAPMQLLALGSGGGITVWAKAFIENWSAFAPDFQELAANECAWLLVGGALLPAAALVEAPPSGLHAKLSS